MTNNFTDKQKQYLVDLQSDNSALVLKTMEAVRENGTVALFPQLFNVYQNTSSEDIRQAFLNIIRDVKDKQAPEIIASEIFNREWDARVAEVLSSVWQSGLDYGKQIEVFVHFVKNEDLNVCMEALTCIEEFFYNQSVSNRDEIRQMLKDIALQTSDIHRDMIMVYLGHLK